MHEFQIQHNIQNSNRLLPSLFALAITVANGHENVVHTFLECEDFDAEWSHRGSKIALELAAESEELTMVELLLVGGVDPNKSSGHPTALAPDMAMLTCARLCI